MPGELTGYKIIHLLTTLNHGGAERVVLDLAHQQRELGAVVHVFCLQARGDLEPAFASARIPVAMVPGAQPAGAVRMAWRVAGALRSAEASVVHTHNSAPQIAAGLGQRLRPWRRPHTALVHTEHGRLPDTRLILLQLRRWTAHVFDAVIAVSSDARDQMMQHGIKSPYGVDVILNGVDVTRFGRSDATATAMSTLVHVGRLDRIKGQDVLIAALPLIRRVVPSVRLVVVGDGPSRASLEAQARALDVSDIVDFIGAVDDVRPWLQSANVFVLPSRSEGISIALLEAMACELAVVATDVGGNREVVRSEDVGRLVPSEDPAALAAAINEMLLAPERARAMGARGRREVVERFSGDVTVQAYAAEYQRAMRGSTPARRIA